MATAPPTTPKAIAAAAAAEPTAPPWLRQVALLTGVLAALGGYLTVRSTSLSNDAIYRSEKATLFQSKASNVWAQYQFSSIKAHIEETQMKIMAPGQSGRDVLEHDAAEFRSRQPPLEASAKELEKQRDEQLANGDKLLAEKELVGYAGMAGQLGIALASVAALTRRKEAYIAALLIGVCALVITVYAVAVHHFVMKA